MSREKGKRIPQPFAKIQYNENTCTQKVIEWIKKIRDEKGLGFGDVVFDTSSDDERRPDALIFERPQSSSILCVIEFKKPTADYLSQRVREKTHSEAKHLDVRKPADLLIPCGMRERLYCSFNTADAVASNSFTEIRLKNVKHRKAI